MSSRCFSRLLLATAAALVVPSAAALADPSGRVARISFVGGPVSFRPASLDEWSLASLNYPLTVGDHLWTDRGGRGELQSHRAAASGPGRDVRACAKPQ